MLPSAIRIDETLKCIEYLHYWNENVFQMTANALALKQEE